MKTIETECGDCDGTGLYIGCAEPQGTAVICCECEGSGCFEFCFKPFTRRKGRRGIKTIVERLGSSKTMTYKEFKQKYRMNIK